MDRRRYSGLTMVGFGVMGCNSALAVCKSWGDAGSVAFVLVANAALVLLFVCLREFEHRRGRARGSGRIKAAVWAFTTVLTAMLAFGVAPTIMPLPVGVLVFICLHDVDHQVRCGVGGGGGNNMDGQYWALAKVGFAMLTCSAALDVAYYAQGDPGSAVLVFVSYVVLVILMGLFVRAFARDHAGGQGQGQEQH